MWFHHLHFKTLYRPNKQITASRCSWQEWRLRVTEWLLSGISWACCDSRIPHFQLWWEWPHTVCMCNAYLVLPPQPPPFDGTAPLFLCFYSIVMILHLQSDLWSRSTLALQEQSEWRWLRQSSVNNHPGEVEFPSEPWCKAFVRNQLLLSDVVS